MALKGNLESFGIAEIFQLIGSQSKTGVLKIETDEMNYLIRFSNGYMVDASPEAHMAADYYGDILVRAGMIKEAHLERALEEQKKTLKKLGDILTKMGAVQKDSFNALLALQNQEIIYKLLMVTRGKYVFSNESLKLEENQPMVGVDALLMEGSRQMDEWPGVLRRIPSEGRVYEKTNKAPEREFTREEAAVYSHVDGKRTVRKLADMSLVGEFNAWDALAGLYDEGYVVEIKKAYQRPDAAVRSRHLGELMSDTLLGVVMAALAAILVITSDFSFTGSLSLYVNSVKNVEEELRLLDLRRADAEELPVAWPPIKKGK